MPGTCSQGVVVEAVKIVLFQRLLHRYIDRQETEIYGLRGGR